MGGMASEKQWDENDAGVLRLPSGRLVRGRGLRHALDPTAPTPTYALYLLGRRPPEVTWESHWLRWPDFRLPADRAAARTALTEAWERAAHHGGPPGSNEAESWGRVEIACGGGRGRTGTALACLAVLDGVPAEEAVDFVRRNYDRHAVETPWQRRYVRRFR